MRRGRACEIALVGMSCRFPGAPDLFAFWANVLANRDMTRELPRVEPAQFLVRDAAHAALADSAIAPERLDRGRVEVVIRSGNSFDSSPLAALELGSRALVDRRADLALVCVVYVEADVDLSLDFSQPGLLARSGTTQSSPVIANGLTPAVGVGVVVLKRLRDAERAGDRIYAVLKGVGLASDGRSRGMTVLALSLPRLVTRCPPPAWRV